jgi:hypothetical protein
MVGTVNKGLSQMCSLCQVGGNKAVAVSFLWGTGPEVGGPSKPWGRVVFWWAKVEWRGERQAGLQEMEGT